MAYLTVTAAGCRKEVHFEPLESPPAAGGAGVHARAVAVTSALESERLFGEDLPGAGILPVHVAVRNIDTLTIAVHHPGAPALGESFEGFVLAGPEGRGVPMHPLEAVKRIKGKEEKPEYRKMGLGHVMAGIVVAPLGLYYVYRGFKYSTEYRPLARRSLLPADETGGFYPLVLRPGEKASGFLLFPCDTSAAECHIDGMELEIHPSGHPGDLARFEAGPGNDLEYRGVEEAEYGQGESIQFVLAANGSRGRRLDLYAIESCGAPAEALVPTEPLVELPDRDGSLAGAAARGTYALCGVNFTRSSRVFIFETGGEGSRLAGEERFERNILKAAAFEEEALVMTVDGTVHFIGYEGAGRQGEAGTASGPDDALFLGDRLFVCADGEIILFERDGNRFDEALRAVLNGESPLIAGTAGDERLVIAVGGGRGKGDTLVTVDARTLSEKDRRPAGGLVMSPAAGDGSFVVYREGGFVIRMALRAGAFPAAGPAGWLDRDIVDVSCCGDRVAAVSSNGELFMFTPGMLEPGPVPGVEGALTFPVSARASAPGGAGTEE